jgi:hypothetical protein
VSPAQAARRGALLAAGAPGLRAGDDVAYRPNGGLRELRGTLLLARALGATHARRNQQHRAARRDAAKSPLTRERTSWEAGVGVTWRL